MRNNNVKTISATTTNGMHQERITCEHTCGMVYVRTRYSNRGGFLVTRFGDGETFNRDWVRSFVAAYGHEVIKW